MAEHKEAASDADADSIVEKVMSVAGPAGFKVYLVGGFVRDKLLGIDSNDLDFVAFHPEHGIEAGKVLARMLAEQQGGSTPAESQQGTAIMRLDDVEVEFAAPRGETYSEDSRQPEVWAADIKEDAMRRDFTINALYLDLQNDSPEFRDRIVDPTGMGLQDLDNKIIRSPNPETAFMDDPLRVLRGVRFPLKLGFDMDPDTQDAITEAAPQVGKILKEREDAEARGETPSGKLSYERMQKELNKILTGKEPGQAMKSMQDYGLLKDVLPEWADMQEMPYDSTPSHTETVVEHTLRAMEGVRDDIVMRLSALFHDFGKPAERKFENDVINFHDHDIRSGELVETILNRWKYPKNIIKRVKFLVENHMRPHQYSDEWSDKAIRRFIREMGDEMENVLELAESDTRARTPQDPAHADEALDSLDRFRGRIQDLQQPEQETVQLVLDGNEIMEAADARPGPWIADVKKFLWEQQDENPNLSKEEAAQMVRDFVEGQGADKQGRLLVTGMRVDLELPDTTVLGEVPITTDEMDVLLMLRSATVTAKHVDIEDSESLVRKGYAKYVDGTYAMTELGLELVVDYLDKETD